MLEGILDAEAAEAKLLTDFELAHTSIGGMWSGILSSAARVCETACAPGGVDWRPSMLTLMKNKDLVKKLVGNQHYPSLSPLTFDIDHQVKACQSFAKDRSNCVDVVASNVLEAATAARKFGVETACLTWILHTVFSVLPKEKT